MNLAFWKFAFGAYADSEGPIRLRMRAVWSGPSLSAYWIIGYCRSKDFYQTVRPCCLIWIYTVDIVPEYIHYLMAWSVAICIYAYMWNGMLINVTRKIDLKLKTLPYLPLVFRQTGPNKHCRPKSDAAQCTVSSGFTMFVTHPVSGPDQTRGCAGCAIWTSLILLPSTFPW